MGISLNEANLVEVSNQCFVFPSFAAMRPSIRKVLTSYIKFKRGKRANQIQKVLDDLFFRKCEYIHKKAPTPGWKKEVDPNLRHRAASVFSDQLEASIIDEENTILIGVNTGFGKVTFAFPCIDDQEFKAAITDVLLKEKDRPPRDQAKRYLEDRLGLFRTHCLAVEGIDGLGNDWKWSVPENWISAAVGRLLGGETWQIQQKL